MFKTYSATIYCGLRQGYFNKLHPLDEARQIVQDYVNKVGLGVSFTQTEFLYTNGSEPGIMVGLINYPRFPSSEEEIKKRAVYLAQILMQSLEQERVSVVCSDETIMLEKNNV